MSGFVETEFKSTGKPVFDSLMEEGCAVCKFSNWQAWSWDGAFKWYPQSETVSCHQGVFRGRYSVKNNATRMERHRRSYLQEALEGCTEFQPA